MNRRTYLDRESLIINDLVSHLITDGIGEGEAWDSVRYTVESYWYLFDGAQESDIITHTLPYIHNAMMEDMLFQASGQPDDLVPIIAREGIIERIHSLLMDNYEVIEQSQLLHLRLSELVESSESFEYAFGWEPERITPSTLTDAFYTWVGMVTEYTPDNPWFPFATEEQAEQAQSIPLSAFNESHVRRLSAIMPDVEYNTVDGEDSLKLSLTATHTSLTAWLDDEHETVKGY